MVNPSLSIGWWGLLKIKLVHDPTVKLCKNVIILIVTGIYLFWALVRGWDTCWSVISKSHSFTSEAQSRGFRSQCQELLRLQGSPRGFVFWKTSFTKRLLISWIISWIIMTWWVTLPTPHYIYIYIYYILQGVPSSSETLLYIQRFNHVTFPFLGWETIFYS